MLVRGENRQSSISKKTMKVLTLLTLGGLHEACVNEQNNNTRPIEVPTLSRRFADCSRTIRGQLRSIRLPEDAAGLPSMRVYGRGGFNSIHRTRNGSLILVGSNGIQGIRIMRVDLVGQVLWDTNVQNEHQANPVTDFARTVIETQAGNFFVLGSLGQATARRDFAADPMISLLGPDGQIQWERRIRFGTRSGYAYSGTQTSDGRFAITVVGGDIPGFAILNFDETGTELSRRIIPRSFYAPTAIFQTGEGFIMSGSSGSGCAVVRFDDAGTGSTVAAMVGEGSINYTLWPICAMTRLCGNGFVVVHTTLISGHDFTGGHILRVNSTGNEMWRRQIVGGPGHSGFNQAILTSDGGYAVVGFRSLQFGTPSMWFVRLDSNGDMLTERTYDTMFRLSYGTSITEIPGGYLLVGYGIPTHTETTDTQFSSVLVRIDQNGNLQGVH